MSAFRFSALITPRQIMWITQRLFSRVLLTSLILYSQRTAQKHGTVYVNANTQPTWGAHGVNALCRMHIAEQSCQTWQSAKQSYKEPETEPHYVFLSTPKLKVNQAFFVLFWRKIWELTDTKYTCNRFMENARMLLCMGSAVAPSLSHLLSGNQSWGARENTRCHAHM